MILPLCPLCEAFCLFGKWLRYPAAIPTISIDIGAPYLNLWSELTRVVPKKLTPTEPRTVYCFSMGFQWGSHLVHGLMHCLPPWRWDSETIWRSFGMAFLTKARWKIWKGLAATTITWCWFATLVGGDWNHGILLDFPDIGNGKIIPTDELHDFSEG